MDKLKLFGTQWCLKSAKLRNFLQAQWVDFEDFNVETEELAEKTVRELYGGELKFPTLTYGDSFLKNPSISELKAFLEKHKIQG
ncbi:MAG: hypothetical protein MK086_12055 [Flavobacteriales bacterium]|nr:hypothetical protein [Flavobacteriales bacterium]